MAGSKVEMDKMEKLYIQKVTELIEWVNALVAVEKPDMNSKKWLMSCLFRMAPSSLEATAVKEKEWVCVGLKSWQSVSKTEQSSEETGPVASYFDNTKNVTLQVDTSKQLRVQLQEEKPVSCASKALTEPQENYRYVRQK